MRSVGGHLPADRGLSGSRVGPLSASEEEDEGLRLVDLVVRPAARLLDPDASPFHLGKDSAARDLLVDLLGEDNVSVFVEVIGVFVGVLDLSGVVRHLGAFANSAFFYFDF